MSIFPGFGGWINQNIQQRPKAESGGPENFKSNSVSANDNNLKPWYDEPGQNEAMEPGDVRSKSLHAVDTKYFDVDEMGKQAQLWHAEKKNHPYRDAPAKVKENKLTKVLKKDGPRQITDVEKVLRWKLLWWSGVIPINLIIDENHQNLTAKYTKKKNKMKYVKLFKGSWKVEPLYVDSERLCNQRGPKSREEYKRCSGGQGRIGSKVTMEQIFQPSSLLNLPPVSWIIRGIIIKTTKILLEDLRQFVIDMYKV